VASRRDSRYPTARTWIDHARPRDAAHPVSDVMRAFLYPQGARVRIKRGSFPVSGDLLGRMGVVVERDDYRPGRYGVVLDDDDQIRDFSEDELEPTKGA